MAGGTSPGSHVTVVVTVCQDPSPISTMNRETYIRTIFVQKKKGAKRKTAMHLFHAEKSLKLKLQTKINLTNTARYSGDVRKNSNKLKIFFMNFIKVYSMRAKREE